MAKKKKRKARTIVTGSLEKINSKVFDQYRKQITEIIKGNYGIYALYRREKLYYIGLATDFKRRIGQHLRDRHKGKWNYFSLYLIRKIDHIREVEALLLRIAKPKGSKVGGRLKGSKNLRPVLKKKLNDEWRKKRDEIMGTKKIVKKKKAGKSSSKGNVLKGLLPNGAGIYASYKGKIYKALVYTNKGIKYKGKFYDTPSGAAKAIVDRRTVNGWGFWKYKNKKGEHVKLRELL